MSTAPPTVNGVSSSCMSSRAKTVLSSHRKSSVLEIVREVRPLAAPRATPKGGPRLLRSRPAPATARAAVAGFHSGSRQSILPPPPRTSAPSRLVARGLIYDQSESKEQVPTHPSRGPASPLRERALLTTLPVNDPASLPPPSPTHRSHHWTFERYVRPPRHEQRHGGWFSFRLLSGALVRLTMAPFAARSLHPAMDPALGAGVLIHSHLGFQYAIACLPVCPASTH